MISHYLYCARCGASQPVDLVESDEGEVDASDATCDACGSDALEVED